jgi:hypothetical protein
MDILQTPSLRRYDPDQVQRVCRGGVYPKATSQFLRGTPLGTFRTLRCDGAVKCSPSRATNGRFRAGLERPGTARIVSANLPVLWRFGLAEGE